MLLTRTSIYLESKTKISLKKAFLFLGFEYIWEMGEFCGGWYPPSSHLQLIISHGTD